MSTDDIKRILEAGGEIEPAQTLWPRLHAARRAMVFRRRAAAGASASLCALALAALVVWPALDHGEVHAPAPTQAASHDTHRIRDELRALDRALQVAYDRGASDVEIAAMWAAREGLAARLAFDSHPVDISGEHI